MDIVIFILVSVGVILTPGPNVIVVVSTCLSHGKLRGLQTVAGISTAMIIQLCVAALGTAWFASMLASGFFWLKWAGVIYLCYLGIISLLNAIKNTQPKPVTGTGSFSRGFWVSLTNPKTILFFGAFLPQFVSPAESYISQIVILSVMFWCLAVVLDSMYAVLADKLKSLLATQFNQSQNYCSGVLYLGASAALANTKIS